jgi:arylsulfatase A-like enzyme
VRPATALGLLVAVVAGGAVAARLVGPGNAAAEGPPPIPRALADRPNVILVMVDTLRADHLSCYGNSEVATPNLCRLAEDGGTLFSGFSHASWTKPATASLLTSLVPSSHGAMSKPSALPQAAVTLAEAMSGRGYVTGGVVSNINLAESFGFGQGFDEYVYLGPDYLAGAAESSSKLILYQIARSVWFKLKGGGLRFGDFYQDSRVVNAVAFDWLERHRDSRFFYFLHYMDPHDPYFAHPYDGHGIARVSNQHPDPALAEEMQRLYVGEIEYLDASFGRMLAKLEELGLYDDTVIALVADHGEEFHEHGGFWHGLTLYEEQIHVPFLVKWAKGDAPLPPDVRQHVVRLIDVAPTLLGRTGADIPVAMQGVDLAGGLGDRAEQDRLHFAEEDHEGNVLRSIRTQRWKWIEANPGNPRGLPELELFEVSSDPTETRNRIDAEPAVAAELARHADGQEQLAQGGRVEGEKVVLSDSELDNLRALGYVVE